MRKQAGAVLGRSWFAMLALALSLVVAAAATSIARPGRTGGSASAGTAKKRPPLPDLVEKSVSRLPSTTHPGQGFTVVDRVKNVGRATAPKSVTKFYLETKLAHDRHLQVPAWYLGPRRVPPLKPRHSSRAVAHLKVPKDDPTLGPPDDGQYYVLGCADGPGKVKESKERNNCKPSSGLITVTTPAGGGGATGTFPHQTSYPGLTGSGSLSFDSTNPNQVKFQVSFSNSVDHVEIWVPRDASLQMMSPVPTYGCGTPGDGDPQSGNPPTANGQTYHGVACDFSAPLAPSTTITGTIATSPAPSAGMGGYLYGSINAHQQVGGPFSLSGP